MNGVLPPVTVNNGVLSDSQLTVSRQAVAAGLALKGVSVAAEGEEESEVDGGRMLLALTAEVESPERVSAGNKSFASVAVQTVGGETPMFSFGRKGSSSDSSPVVSSDEAEERRQEGGGEERPPRPLEECLTIFKSDVSELHCRFITPYNTVSGCCVGIPGYILELSSLRAGRLLSQTWRSCNW